MKRGNVEKDRYETKRNETTRDETKMEMGGVDGLRIEDVDLARFLRIFVRHSRSFLLLASSNTSSTRGQAVASSCLPILARCACVGFSPGNGQSPAVRLYKRNGERYT